MSEQNVQPSPQELEQLDAYVDKRNVSYAEARRNLGMPEAANDMFTADRVQARLDAHKTNVALYHVPDNPNPPEFTEAEQASMEASKAEARQAIRGVGGTALRG